MTIADALGHAPEELSLPLREMVTGLWVGLEMYDPHRLPLRKIAVIAKTPGECFESLQAKGLDVSHFEVIQLAFSNPGMGLKVCGGAGTPF